MHSPRRPGRDRSGLISGTVESVLTAGAVVMLLASIMGLTALISAAFTPPMVGEIVQFRPGVSVIDMSFAAHLVGSEGQPGVGCLLDPEKMVQGGGSLVVEARVLQRHEYQVHWAGGPTAASAEDCGRSANLLVTQADLETLVNIMGGRGIAGRGDVF